MRLAKPPESLHVPKVTARAVEPTEVIPFQHRNSTDASSCPGVIPRAILGALPGTPLRLRASAPYANRQRAISADLQNVPLSGTICNMERTRTAGENPPKASDLADWALSRGISSVTTEEIAQLLGVPQNQVWKRLHALEQANVDLGDFPLSGNRNGR